MMISIPDPEQLQLELVTPAPVPWTQQWINAAQAYQDSQVRLASEQQTTKVEAVEEKYEGGWRCEGKEKPVTPLVCSRCQWIRRNEQSQEPDNKDWCDYCLKGEILGHEPDKSYRPPAPKVGDKLVLNQTFFG